MWVREERKQQGYKRITAGVSKIQIYKRWPITGHRARCHGPFGSHWGLPWSVPVCKWLSSSRLGTGQPGWMGKPPRMAFEATVRDDVCRLRYQGRALEVSTKERRRWRFIEIKLTWPALKWYWEWIEKKRCTSLSKKLKDASSKPMEIVARFKTSLSPCVAPLKC